MQGQVIWIAFFVVLMLLGFCVAIVPSKVARLIGAPTRFQKPGPLLAWRGLGAMVLVGSVVELVMLFISSHVVR